MKDKLDLIPLILLLLVMIGVAFVIIVYGNTPAGEMPTWFWFIFGR